MDTDFGIAFTGLPPLRHIRDLEAFEGPILSELRAPNNGVYLEKWCTYLEDAVRTLLVRSDPRSIAEYLAERTTMLDLLTKPNDDVGFLVDYHKGGLRTVRLVQVTTLPPKYLPKPTAKHDISLRPEWDTTPQSFLVDAAWDAQLLFELEKTYLTVYAFNYFISNTSDIQPPLAMHHYVLKGYGYNGLFKVLRRSVPTNDNAHSVGVAAASPGVLTIAAPTMMAERMAKSLSAATKKHTVRAYGILYAWSRKPEEKANEISATALSDIQRLCEYLYVDPAKILPNAPSDGFSKAQLLRAGKVIAAYYRAQRRLLSPHQSGVEFLAPLGTHDETEPPPYLLQDDSDDEDYEEEDDDYDEDYE